MTSTQEPYEVTRTHGFTRYELKGFEATVTKQTSGTWEVALSGPEGVIKTGSINIEDTTTPYARRNMAEGQAQRALLDLELLSNPASSKLTEALAQLDAVKKILSLELMPLGEGWTHTEPGRLQLANAVAKAIGYERKA